jgi:hypothetical protein
MTYIDAHLYSGATRVGTSTNPLYVTFADASAEFVPTFTPKIKEDFSPLFEERIITKEVEKEVIKEVIKEVVKEVPVYNIKGSGFIFNFWFKIGRRLGYVR